MTSCCNNDTRSELIALYTKLAENPDSDFGWSKGKANARQLGYAEEWLHRLPDVVWESAAAVGNPFKPGVIISGQTILDIGCGAGADACVAALLTGHTGQVIGIDCTPAMITKARANAMHAKVDNVTFHQADIDSLPLADKSIDVVISNGAINLAENKGKVFQELYRVLKPGGRLQFADMVRVSDNCCTIEANTESWADCVQGTLPVTTLLKIITDAGFTDATLVELTGYKTSEITNGALMSALCEKT